MIPGLGEVRDRADGGFDVHEGLGKWRRAGIHTEFRWNSKPAAHSPRSPLTVAPWDGRILLHDPCPRARLGAAFPRRCRSVPAQGARLPARALGARRGRGTGAAPAGRRRCVCRHRRRIAHAPLGGGERGRARAAAGQGAEPARRFAPSRWHIAWARRRVQLLEAARPRQPPARLRQGTHAARGLHRARDGRRAVPALQRALRGGAASRMRDRRAPCAFAPRARLARGAGARCDGGVELRRPAVQERDTAAAARAAGCARADRRAQIAA